MMPQALAKLRQLEVAYYRGFITARAYNERKAVFLAEAVAAKRQARLELVECGVKSMVPS